MAKGASGGDGKPAAGGVRHPLKADGSIDWIGVWNRSEPSLEGWTCSHRWPHGQCPAPAVRWVGRMARCQEH